jgi:hypothetical protein
LTRINPLASLIAMGITRFALISSAAVLLAAMPVLAHHRVEVQYDPSHPVMLHGTVTKVAWINPHVLVQVEVAGDGGSVMDWTIQMGSPNQQLMKGWKIDTLKQGDHVLVDAYPARDGSNLGYATKVTRTAR